MAKTSKSHEFHPEARFRFCGNDGEGIPGLPHLVSMGEAQALGLLDALQAALANGNYQPVEETSGAPAPKEA
jgi:hypothetical protein